MRPITRIFSVFFALFVLTAAVSASTACAASKTLILATTTSTQESGLLEVLVPMFE